MGVRLVLLPLAVALMLAVPAKADGLQIRTFRVCADPDNLPFSDRAGSGYENKIAEVLAASIGKPLEYAWFPHGIGFVRQTLLRGRCDVILGAVRAHEGVRLTRPYMRAGYSLVAPAGVLPQDLSQIDDDRLADLTIGVVTGSAPAAHLARLNRITGARPYRPIPDKRYGAPISQMLADLAVGDTDAILLWWPIAAHVVRDSDGTLEARPVTADSDPPLAAEVGIALRRNEEAWQNYLEYQLDKNSAAIDSILANYGIAAAKGD